MSVLLLLNHLCVDVSDQCFKVTIHLCQHGKSTLARVERFLFRLLVDLCDRAVEGGLTLAYPHDVLLVLVHLGLFMPVALPGHLTEVGLADVLGLRAAHLGLDAANESLLTGVITSQTSFLDSGFDLACREELSLLDHLVGALLKLLADWAELLSLLGWLLGVVGVHILVGDIVLHPVDVE